MRAASPSLRGPALQSESERERIFVRWKIEVRPPTGWWCWPGTPSIDERCLRPSHVPAGHDSLEMYTPGHPLCVGPYYHYLKERERDPGRCCRMMTRRVPLPPSTKQSAGGGALSRLASFFLLFSLSIVFFFFGMKICFHRSMMIVSPPRETYRVTHALQ